MVMASREGGEGSLQRRAGIDGRFVEAASRSTWMDMEYQSRVPTYQNGTTDGKLEC